MSEQLGEFMRVSVGISRQARRLKMDLDELVEALEVRTNILNEEKRLAALKEHNARAMAEALGRADI